MSLLRLLTAIVASLPLPALALENRFITLRSIPGTGRFISFPEALANVIGFLAASSALVATTLFLVGAFTLVASHGKPEGAGAGKKLMTNSLVGMAIVLLSYTILRTFLYIVYVI